MVVFERRANDMPTYNQYGNYPYGNPYQPYGVNPNMYQNNGYAQQMPQQQQPQFQPMQQPQTSYLPLTFTSGLVGAKSFIVAPNQTVFLKDSDEGSNLLFEKRADQNGRYTLKVYELNEIKVDDIGKPKEVFKNPEVQITKEDMQHFATKDDLIALQRVFEVQMNNLSTLIQKGSKNGKNFVKDSEKNE